MKYNKLKQYVIEHCDKPLTTIFTELGISTQTLYSMNHPGEDIYGHANGGSISLSIIDRLCSYLNCQPSDIMELDSQYARNVQDINVNS